MNSRLPIFISLGLAAAVLVAFSPVLLCGFIDWDDNIYVFANPHVRTGLSVDNFVWAWTSYHAYYWHPLTWLSHMLDCQLFGLNARGHHFVNLLFHLANTVGLFLVLRRMTWDTWRSALVAALFGLHPLRVESVAWIAERKDVLSTFCAILTLAAYTAYAARPSLGRYLTVLAVFALGLLAKPMLVTLPFGLLLLDYWPLRRWPSFAKDDGQRPDRDMPSYSPAAWGRLVLEKVPLLVLTLLSSLLTLRTQHEAMVSAENLSLGARIANAVVSYTAYLRKTVWPTDLAALYQHPRDGLSTAHIAAAASVLAALTILALTQLRRRPAVPVGWLWFLGMLVPVSGLVQVGSQAMADRFTYVPHIGLLLAVVWAIPDLPASRLAARIWLGAATLILTACIVLTWRQTLSWRNDQTLWQHAFQVADGPAVHRLWANFLYQRGYVDEAEVEYKAALRLNPDFSPALRDLGMCYLHQGDFDRSLAAFRHGSTVDPHSSWQRNGVGMALLCQGRTEEACQCFREACGLKPDIAEYHYNLATALMRRGERAEAEEEYREGRRLDPNWPARSSLLARQLLSRKNPKTYCPIEAVFLAEQACQGSAEPHPEMLQTLAEAYAAERGASAP